jgi:hypothetical protein
LIEIDCTDIESPEDKEDECGNHYVGRAEIFQIEYFYKQKTRLSAGVNSSTSF